MAQINLLQGRSQAKKKVLVGQGKASAKADKYPSFLKFDITKSSSWFRKIAISVAAFMIIVEAIILVTAFFYNIKMDSFNKKGAVFEDVPKQLKEAQEKKKSLDESLQVLVSFFTTETPFSAVLNILSNNVNDGIWFEEINFEKKTITVAKNADKNLKKADKPAKSSKTNKDNKDIEVKIAKIKGKVYYPISQEEIDLLGEFSQVIKNDPQYSSLFSSISIGAISNSKVFNFDTLDFTMELELK